MVGGILCGIVWMVGSVLGKSQDDWIAEAKQEMCIRDRCIDERVRQHESRRAGAERERIEAVHGRVEQPVHAARDAKDVYKRQP